MKCTQWTRTDRNWAWISNYCVISLNYGNGNTNNMKWWTSRVSRTGPMIIDGVQRKCHVVNYKHELAWRSANVLLTSCLFHDLRDVEMKTNWNRGNKLESYATDKDWPAFLFLSARIFVPVLWPCMCPLNRILVFTFSISNSLFMYSHLFIEPNLNSIFVLCPCIVRGKSNKILSQHER
jgi:hypothetical protein